MELYICDIKENNIKDNFEEYLGRLSSEDQKKVLDCKVRDVALLRLARYLLFDQVCRKKFGGHIPPTVLGDHGKPFFLPPYDENYFNISHSGDMVILGLSKAPIGVDVEKIERFHGKKGIIRFFGDGEKELLQKDDSDREFCRIWTYRESFSKLIGQGLVLFEKEQVTIDHENDRVSFKGKDYIFSSFERDGYIITACMTEADGIWVKTVSDLGILCVHNTENMV